MQYNKNLYTMKECGTMQSVTSWISCILPLSVVFKRSDSSYLSLALSHLPSRDSIFFCCSVMWSYILAAVGVGAGVRDDSRPFLLGVPVFPSSSLIPTPTPSWLSSKSLNMS
jgi:hypothetical protein